MRNITLSLAAVAALAACDPAIRKFEVTPKQLQCPGQAVVKWEINGPGGELSTSKPVVPPLPLHPPELIGSQTVTVSETTEFSFVVPGAGHRHQVVEVLNKPNLKQLTFNGVCKDAVTGPTYDLIKLSAAEAPGKLTGISSNADWPVHVFLNGTEIALAAGGGPLSPLPDIAAAGTYSITIPGVVGPGICKNLGAEGGGPLGSGNPVPAPPITISVSGSCQ
jgi:hypothetical protein